MGIICSSESNTLQPEKMLFSPRKKETVTGRQETGIGAWNVAMQPKVFRNVKYKVAMIKNK